MSTTEFMHANSELPNDPTPLEPTQSEVEARIDLPVDSSRRANAQLPLNKELQRLRKLRVFEKAEPGHVAEPTALRMIGGRRMLFATSAGVRDYMDRQSVSNRMVQYVLLAALDRGHRVATVRVPYHYYRVPLDEPIYVLPPAQLARGQLWRLKKLIPGLLFSQQRWHEHLAGVLVEAGAEPVLVAPSGVCTQGCFRAGPVTVLVSQNELMLAGPQERVRSLVSRIDAGLGGGSVNTCMFFNGYKIDGPPVGRLWLSVPGRVDAVVLPWAKELTRHQFIRRDRYVSEPIDASEVAQAFRIRHGEAASPPLPSKLVARFKMWQGKLRSLARKLRRDVMHAVLLLDLVLGEYSAEDGDNIDEFDCSGVAPRIVLTEHHLHMLLRILAYLKWSKHDTTELVRDADSVVRSEHREHHDRYGPFEVTRYEELVFYGDSQIALSMKLERGAGTQQFMAAWFADFKKQCEDQLALAKSSVSSEFGDASTHEDLDEQPRRAASTAHGDDNEYADSDSDTNPGERTVAALARSVFALDLADELLRPDTKQGKPEPKGKPQRKPQQRKPQMNSTKAQLAKAQSAEAQPKQAKPQQANARQAEPKSGNSKKTTAKQEAHPQAPQPANDSDDANNIDYATRLSGLRQEMREIYDLGPDWLDRGIVAQMEACVSALEALYESGPILDSDAPDSSVSDGWVEVDDPF